VKRMKSRTCMLPMLLSSLPVPVSPTLKCTHVMRIETHPGLFFCDSRCKPHGIYRSCQLRYCYSYHQLFPSFQIIDQSLQSYPPHHDPTLSFCTFTSKKACIALILSH
jgi:hypothetical protein